MNVLLMSDSIDCLHAV